MRQQKLQKTGAWFAGLSTWQVVILSIFVSVLGGLSGGLPQQTDSQRAYYAQLEQAPWAPPGWIFGPVWTLNNILLMLALRRLVRSNMPRRRKLLWLQAGIWIIYFSFNFIYFNRKSTVLAAVWTQTDALLALSSMVIARKSDRRLALLFLPLTLWTWFASSVAHYQALTNPDPLLNTPALLQRK